MPFHVNAAMFRVGATDVVLLSLGRSELPPDVESHLLLLLHSRAVAHKL